MDNPPYDDVVMQIVSRESNLHCSVSSIRTLPGLLLSSLKGEFLNSFVIAWVIEINRLSMENSPRPRRRRLHFGLF